MRHLAALVLACVAAFAASADITTDPPAPTTQSFVMLHVSNAWGGTCYPADDWTMERSDRTFDIHYATAGCTLQVGGWAFEHPLGTLEPGLYTVRLWHGEELKRT